MEKYVLQVTLQEEKEVCGTENMIAGVEGCIEGGIYDI